MNCRNLLLISASILIFVSCKHKTTVVESKYPDQTPKVVRTYNVSGDSKELLSEKTFYPGNKIQMEGTYKDNKRDGRWVYYHSNGKPWSEGFFRNGKSNGRRVTYYESGNIQYEGFYKDDKKVGVWKFYDNNGKLMKQVDFSKANGMQEPADSVAAR